MSFNYEITLQTIDAQELLHAFSFSFASAAFALKLLSLRRTNKHGL